MPTDTNNSNRSSTDLWLDEIQFIKNTSRSNQVRALLYGESGSGKTHLAGTFPNPFFIDSDKGLATLWSLDKNVPYLELQRGTKVFPKILQVLKQIREKSSAFFEEYDVKTLVFDSLTSLSDMILIEAMMYPQDGSLAKNPNTSKPEWDHYTAVLNRMKHLMKMSQDIGVNVVATAGEQLGKDEVRGTFIGKPAIIGSYRNVVPYDFDEMYYMTSKTTKEGTDYMLFSSKYLYYEAKSRLGIENEVHNPSYKKLYESIITMEGE